MKILVIGGTNFVGRHIVEAAVRNKHEVTMFNRGQQNKENIQGVERLFGDRDGNLDVLTGRKWDAVIDSCGFFPRAVRQSAELLKDSVDTYVFISTISVYSDFTKENMDESSPLFSAEQELPEEKTPENYGPLKVQCENAVKEVFPERNIIIRPGFIVGPFDYSDRFTYWVERIARGGDVLVPGQFNTPLQLIDGRDMADWIIRLLEQKVTGTFNATCPQHSYNFGEMLNEAMACVNSNSNLHWVEDAQLDGKVQPFLELPFWVPRAWNSPGYFSINTDKAIQRGLTVRPLRQTIMDILEWTRKRGQEKREVGLDPQKEKKILEELKITR
jgi:2'-hydroxyisoflavone reductase